MKKNLFPEVLLLMLVVFLTAFIGCTEHQTAPPNQGENEKTTAIPNENKQGEETGTGGESLKEPADKDKKTQQPSSEKTSLYDNNNRVKTNDPVKNFISGCSLYEPLQHGNITIIPIEAPAAELSGKLLTLDKALSEKTFIVGEISDSGSVNTLSVKNNSDSPVFIMAGEILKGSKQDRVLEKDLIIPQKSKKINVNAFCVESNRWRYSSSNFYSLGENANVSVRKSAKFSNSQSKVWMAVGGTNHAAVAAPEGSLSYSYQSENFKTKKKEYIGKFKDLPSQMPKVNGVMVLVDGKVMVADIYANPAIFRQYWKKLLDSYILEAMYQEGMAKAGKEEKTKVTKADKDGKEEAKKEEDKDEIKNKEAQKEKEKPVDQAKNFLKQVNEAEVTYTDSPGTGKQAKITSEKIRGAGILRKDIPIHMDIYPRGEDEKEDENSGLQRRY